MRLAAAHEVMKNERAAADRPQARGRAAAGLRAGARRPGRAGDPPGQIDDALAIARELQKASPKSAVGYLFEGDILLSQKKFALALPAYQQGGAARTTPSPC
jgi:hypothetical protein